MKLLFISDIHGLKSNLEKIKSKFIEFNCDKLIVLGDLYYLSPFARNDKDYDVQYIKDFLEAFKDKLICIRGNCDSDEDIITSNFKIIDEIYSLSLNNKELYLTHGHIYNETNWKKENSILIFGHYHVPFIKEEENTLYINPGSISRPRENNPTYLYFDGKSFIIYDIYDKIIDEKKIF
ncbi:MAG: phosphodiesterase [Bacilli bacterium]|nr:phosphodiesterase [Bacilli bacterium]